MKINNVKYGIVIFIVAFIVFIAPLIFTISVKKQVDLYGFSPTEESSDRLEEHIKEHLWIFSMLNLAENLPYYQVTPNVDDVGPAIEYLSRDGNVVGTVAFDSLSCLTEGIYDTEEALKINKNDWVNCEYIKDFGGGFTSTGEPKPRVDITIGTMGFLLILFAFFVVWNSFVLLVAGSIKIVSSITYHLVGLK